MSSYFTAENTPIKSIPLYNFEPDLDILYFDCIDLPNCLYIGFKPVSEVICLWLASGYFKNRCNSTIAPISPIPVKDIILL